MNPNSDTNTSTPENPSVLFDPLDTLDDLLEETHQPYIPVKTRNSKLMSKFRRVREESDEEVVESLIGFAVKNRKIDRDLVAEEEKNVTLSLY